MIAEIGSPHLKACIDAPLAARQGVSSMQQAAKEVGALQVLSHYGGEDHSRPDGASAGSSVILTSR